jgi:apolipoprotein N-acyltransferase
VILVGGFCGQWEMSRDIGPDGPPVRVVQPNTPQAEKWQDTNRGAQLRKLIDLSRRDGFDGLAAVVWPETAVPFIVTPDSQSLPLLATAAPPNGYLLAGAARAAGRIEDGVWNSLLVISPAGKIVATYDKVHLVPLGEYIPFHRQLAPVSGMIGRGSFEEGTGPATLQLPNLPAVAPSICYEAIFPDAIVDGGHRPRWLVNVTNDAWFGVSTGPYQHLTSARLRAVEEGLPMIRAANTGVSAVIDAYGGIVASLDMEKEGVIDRRLPPARAATPYSRWGDWMLALMIVILAFMLVAARSRGKAAR